MTPKRRVHVGSSAERAEGDSSRLYTPFPSRVLVGDVTAGAIAPSVSLPITTVQNPSVPWAPLAYTAAPDVRQAIPIVPVDSAAVAPSSHRGSGASNGKSQSPPSMLVREAAKRRGAGLSGTPRVGGAPLPSRSVDAGDLLDAGLGALYYSVGTGVIEHEAHERRRHLLLGTEAVQAGRMAEGTEKLTEGCFPSSALPNIVRRRRRHRQALRARHGIRRFHSRRHGLSQSHRCVVARSEAVVRVDVPQRHLAARFAGALGSGWFRTGRCRESAVTSAIVLRRVAKPARHDPMAAGWRQVAHLHAAAEEPR